jgi:rhodanese-related sulfurtransferase
MPNYASIIDHANDARTRIKEVEFSEIDPPGLNGTIYLDVRESAEYNSGHIDGALLLPRLEIAEKVAELIPNKGTPIVAYCAIGHRSAIAADVLQDLGYTQVVSLKGGLQALGEAASLSLVA